MITIYLSEDTNKLLNVDAGQDYLIPFPEAHKHPKKIKVFLDIILDRVCANEDVSLLTHSKEALEVIVDYVEDSEEMTHLDCLIIFLEEEGGQRVSTLDKDYCFVNWQIGCMSAR